MKKAFLQFLIILLLPFYSFSQTATLRGFVYFKENGEPVPFTNVFLKGTTHGVQTDVNGYYSINKIPPGTHTLLVLYIGYDSIRETISLKADDIITKKLYLQKKSIALAGVEITAEKQEKLSEVKVSVTTVTPREIKKIPSVGGEPDLAQYLQILPGVVFTGDQGGQLYIRGGSPIQNKVLLDGMVVYNPFHSIGLFSVFDTDIIRNADVYTGGFNATYGGRISSVMDITTRDGNKKRLGGKVSASPFGAKALLEGPLSKQRETGDYEESEQISSEIDKIQNERSELERINITQDSLRRVYLLEKQKADAVLSGPDSVSADVAEKARKESARLKISADTAALLMNKNNIRIYKYNDQLNELNRKYQKTLPRDGSSSFILSAKNSYLPSTSKVLYTYVDTAGLPFSFNDYYGKVSFNASNGSKVNLFGFNFSDKVSYKALSNLEWNSFGGGSNFIAIPANSAVLVSGNFAYSQYEIGIAEEIEKPRSSEINGFNLGLDFTYYARKNEIKYGVEVLGFKTAYVLYSYVNRRIERTDYTTEMAGFFRYKYFSKDEKMVLEPSLRIHYYASLKDISPEPRLGLKYNITKNIRFKSAGGFYSQNLLSATSERDVVNLFYGFLSGPDNLQETFTGIDGQVRDVKHNLQKAYHIIAGVEFDVMEHFDVNLEAYQKNFTQLTSINRFKLYEDDADNSDKPDHLKKDFIIETGDARGADILIKYDYRHLYIWAVYSLGFVTRWDGMDEYRPHFDRRHNVNLVASWTFGKDLDWEADVRWNLGSGFPFTPTSGYYENYDFLNGINSDYTKANGKLGILYGENNSRELPYYHRLDIGVKKTFALRQNTDLEISAGATNAYNRPNIFYFDRIQYKRVNQLPILPSVSANLTF